MRFATWMFLPILFLSLSCEALAQTNGLFGPRVLGSPIRPGASQFDDSLQRGPERARSWARVAPPAKTCSRLRGGSRPKHPSISPLRTGCCPMASWRPSRPISSCRTAPYCRRPRPRNRRQRPRRSANRKRPLAGRCGRLCSPGPTGVAALAHRRTPVERRCDAQQFSAATRRSVAPRASR